jgi:SnoaL-like domain
MNLEQLTALEDIRLAKARYCRLIDLKQWENLRQSFAQEISLAFYDVRGGVTNEFNDIDHFMSLTSSRLQSARTIHQVHNPEIELISATTASAIWSMEDRIVFPDGVAGPFKSLHGFGHYHEVLQKTGGTWRISRLELRRTILDIR